VLGFYLNPVIESLTVVINRCFFAFFMSGVTLGKVETRTNS
jgi:hypothetical protein